MQTWTNSQPMPRPLLWPVRSPVMRCPALETQELFDIDVNDLAWVFSLVAAFRLGCLQIAYPV